MTGATYHTFDPADVLQEFGDVETVAELLAIVITDLTGYVDQLLAARRSGDATRIRSVAHAIKGAVGNVAAKECRAVAERIDYGLREGRAEVIDLVPSLVDECRYLQTELTHWLEASRQPARL